MAANQDAERARLWAKFQACDKDKNGSITVDELRASLLSGCDYQRPFSYEVCRMMMSMYDKNRNGRLTFDEYVNLDGYIRNWYGYFTRNDVNRDGRLEHRDFQTAITGLGFRLNQDFFNQIWMDLMKGAGSNGVVFDQFMHVCIVMQMLTNAWNKRVPNNVTTLEIEHVDFASIIMGIRPIR
uniref:Sorcin-like n=1 Tax=Ciona intestinalis TaxID=7719 RepID=F6X892_CIOIN|nr:sorcin-like [Ciona intestinalis]|eukprot:XP_002119334.1 sorcin-like [Ciona intestinalis]